MAPLKTTVLALLAFWAPMSTAYPTAPPPELATKTSIYTFSTSTAGVVMNLFYVGLIVQTRTGTATRLEPEPTAFPATVVVEVISTITIFKSLYSIPGLMPITPTATPWVTTDQTYVERKRTTTVVTAPTPTE